MTKGIRQYAEARFSKLLPKVNHGMTGTQFRAKVIDDIMTQFGTTLASAAAAYSYVIGKFREEQPKSVEMLGRRSAAEPVRVASAVPSIAGNVTLIRATGGQVVVPSIPRVLAADLMAASGKGRNRPKLLIKEDLEDDE